MWIITALLVLVGWTGVGFVVALLLFRMGFGFEARRDAAERMPQPPEPDIHRHRAADPGYALTPAHYSRRRRGRGRPYQTRPVVDEMSDGMAEERSERERLRPAG